MPIRLNQITIIIVCLITLSSHTLQKKEDIYILFDNSNGDVKRDFNKNSVIFSLKDHEKVSKGTRHQLNYFIYDSLKHKRKNVKYSDYKDKLISGKEAVCKVDKLLEAHENRIFKNPYYYNKYFNHIYIYEKIDNNKGILYEVEWNWGIQ